MHIWRLPSVMPIKSRGQVYLRNLRRTLREIEPEIIHIHGLWYLPTLQTMACRPSSTLVADDHADNGNLPSGPGNLIRFGFARWVCKRLCREGGKIFSVNPFSRWFVTEVLAAPPDNVHFLPLGINTQTFYPDPEKRKEAREQLSLPPDACVFITSGRLTPGKGFELLIERFGEVYRTHRASRLIIIGSGSKTYETQLRRLAKERGIEDAFILLSWMAQADLCTYYNAADVGVLPGKLGGIREILAVGRPLIVPDHLATRYFIERGNGLAFSPNDPPASAKPCCSMPGNQNSANNMGKNRLRSPEIISRGRQLLATVCRFTLICPGRDQRQDGAPWNSQRQSAGSLGPRLRSWKTLMSSHRYMETAQ